MNGASVKTTAEEQKDTTEGECTFTGMISAISLLASSAKSCIKIINKHLGLAKTWSCVKCAMDYKNRQKGQVVGLKI